MPLCVPQRVVAQIRRRLMALFEHEARVDERPQYGIGNARLGRSRPLRFTEATECDDRRLVDGYGGVEVRREGGPATRPMPGVMAAEERAQVEHHVLARLEIEHAAAPERGFRIIQVDLLPSSCARKGLP